MSPRKSKKAFGGKITTSPPSWLSEPESDLKSADSSLVKLSDLHLPASQPRHYFDSQALQELVASIKLHGILQPLLVRPLSEGGYELVAGERRYRAATEAGLSEVPVVVKELDNQSAWAIALIENLQREDLNPLEETEGIVQLLAIKLESDFEDAILTLYRLQKSLKSSSDQNVLVNNQSAQSNISSSELLIVEEVFHSLGLVNWESFVKNKLPLLNLPEDLKSALRSGLIAYTKATALSLLKDEELRTELLAEVIDQQLSLSQIKARIKSMKSDSLLHQPEIPDRLKAVYQQVKKNRLWEDKKKRRKLETLLNKLENLIG